MHTAHLDYHKEMGHPISHTCDDDGTFASAEHI